MRNHKWSFDACVGRAKLLSNFKDHVIPCTKTLYNLLWNGELPLTLFDLPEVLSRRPKGKPRLHKRTYGKSIEERPKEIDERIVFGHWESDTVLGLKRKGESAIFTIVERVTGCYLSIKIDEKNTDGVAKAMAELKEHFGDKFNQVFKSITNLYTDNGSEFADFHSFEELGTQIYFANPYSSWERPVNERTNRILRKYVPKGKSISTFSSDQIAMFSEELFEIELDNIYKLT